MEPKRILVNSDEYKTKGVYLFADDAGKLYLDEEHTQGVTGEELKHFFLLNAVVVTGDAYYTAVQFAPGATSGAKVLTVGEAGAIMIFLSGDFSEEVPGVYTWDGNTEGRVSIEGVYYLVSDTVPEITEGDKLICAVQPSSGDESGEGSIELMNEADGVYMYRAIPTKDSGFYSSLDSYAYIFTGDVTFPDTDNTYPAGVYFYRDDSICVTRLELCTE